MVVSGIAYAELINCEVQSRTATIAADVADMIRRFTGLGARTYGIIEPADNVVVSAATLLPNYNDGHLVSAIETAEGYRGRGYATAILDKLGTVAAKAGSTYLFLSARPDIVDFYKKRGFERAYGYNATAHLMCKYLLAEGSIQ